MKKILLLVDHRNWFYSSIIRDEYTMDIAALERHFDEQGYRLLRKSFPEVDFRSKNYNGMPVLYQSSEDPGLQYKEYIEDILLGLHEQGAVLIPAFRYFRAHHNKVFMEILRDLSGSPALKTIRSKGYGTREEFEADSSQEKGTIVIKTSAGAGGESVRLATTAGERRKSVIQLSRSPLPLFEILKNFIRPLVRKLSHTYARTHVPHSQYRKKFIIQNYIPELQGDYKVIIFGKKYYVLMRHNRPDDFRASGSGLFEWVAQPPEGLLGCAKRVFDYFQVPFLALDMAFDGKRFHVLEFQFVMFGTLTMEKSQFCFIRHDDTWKLVSEKPDLEKEFTVSVVQYIEKTDQ